MCEIFGAYMRDFESGAKNSFLHLSLLSQCGILLGENPAKRENPACGILGRHPYAKDAVLRTKRSGLFIVAVSCAKLQAIKVAMSSHAWMILGQQEQRGA
jgi:hypothetical protein